MKTTLKIATLLSLSISASILMAEENQAKKYFIENAKISYEIKGSGNVMGMMKTETIGKKRLIFNQFGMNELTEENKIEKTTRDGKTEIAKNHTLKYLKGSIIYSVDFENKRIMRSKNPGMALAQLFSGGNNMAEAGEAMMKKMGGKKTGTDEVAGTTCDVWELMGTKQCIYKGSPLRIESNIMGIKTTEVATKAEFDIDVTKDDLKLPDFPVYAYDVDEMIQGKEPKQLDKATLEEMDAKEAIQATKDAERAQEAFKMMAEAANKSGIKEGEKATEQQQGAMIKNMENAMLPMLKKRMLNQAKMAKFGAECFKAANKLKEANACNKKIAEKFPSEDNDMEDFDEWNPKIKKEMLTDINEFLGSIDCVKASTKMDELQKCLPKDE